MKEGKSSVAENNEHVANRNRRIEIGRILHLKSEIRNLKLDRVHFEISDFGFEMQDSSNFNFLFSDLCLDLTDQALILGIIFIEHYRALSCYQSIG